MPFQEILNLTWRGHGNAVKLIWASITCSEVVKQRAALSNLTSSSLFAQTALLRTSWRVNGILIDGVGKSVYPEIDPLPIDGAVTLLLWHLNLATLSLTDKRSPYGGRREIHCFLITDNSREDRRKENKEIMTWMLKFTQCSGEGRSSVTRFSVLLTTI